MRYVLYISSLVFLAFVTLETYRSYVDIIVPFLDHHTKNTVFYDYVEYWIGSIHTKQIFGFTFKETRYGLLFNINNVLRTTFFSFFV